MYANDSTSFACHMKGHMALIDTDLLKAANACRHTISNGILLSTLFSRFFSSFPHGTCSLSVIDTS